MTAAELYEVVKDVPREAWPTMVVFVANMWAFETKAYPTGTKSHFIPTEVAESAFVGSMTAWLASNERFRRCMFGRMDTTQRQACFSTTGNRTTHHPSSRPSLRRARRQHDN